MGVSKSARPPQKNSCATPNFPPAPCGLREARGRGGATFAVRRRLSDFSKSRVRRRGRTPCFSRTCFSKCAFTATPPRRTRGSAIPPPQATRRRQCLRRAIFRARRGLLNRSAEIFAKRFRGLPNSARATLPPPENTSKSALKNFPTTPAFCAHWAARAPELGDWGAADAHYARASLDPRFESAARYGMLRSAVARGDFVAAHSLAAALAKKYPEFSEYAKYLEKQISR